MATCSILILNKEPGCFNSHSQEFTGNCDSYVVRISPSSEALGPFDIYLDGTLVQSDVTREELIDGVVVTCGCTPTPTPTPTLTPGLSPTTTPTPTSTPNTSPSQTPTYTPTPSVTTTTTPTVTPTVTITPSQTSPSFSAYLFVDRNDSTVRNALASYMASQGSSFGGFNVNSPSSVQATFDAQMNSYISYSGWGVSEPQIYVTGVTSTNGGLDAYGNAIQAYKFQTVKVDASVVPPNEFAFYTWIVPTGATNGMRYDTIVFGISNPPSTNFYMNDTFSQLVVNYTGSTNIPQGTYRVYTTKPDTGLRIQNNGNDLYFRGNNLE